MKQSLQLKLSQHLTLTPQLQQSIRLLQLSTTELNQELERFLLENPLLEREEGQQEQQPIGAPLNGAASQEQPVAPAQDDRRSEDDAGETRTREEDWFAEAGHQTRSRED